MTSTCPFDSIQLRLLIYFCRPVSQTINKRYRFLVSLPCIEPESHTRAIPFYALTTLKWFRIEGKRRRGSDGHLLAFLWVTILSLRFTVCPLYHWLSLKILIMHPAVHLACHTPLIQLTCFSTTNDIDNVFIIRRLHQRILFPSHQAAESLTLSSYSQRSTTAAHAG